MPDSDVLARRGVRVLLRTSGYVFAFGLLLILLDALAGIQIPQPFRAALPWLLVASSVVGITLLVGALGRSSRGTPPSRNRLPPESSSS